MMMPSPPPSPATLAIVVVPHEVVKLHGVGAVGASVTVLTFSLPLSMTMTLSVPNGLSPGKVMVQVEPLLLWNLTVSFLTVVTDAGLGRQFASMMIFCSAINSSMSFAGGGIRRLF